MSVFTWNESVQVQSLLPKNREEPDSPELLLDKSFSLYSDHLPMETSWANAHPESVNESLCPAEMHYLILLLKMNEVGFD